MPVRLDLDSPTQTYLTKRFVDWCAANGLEADADSWTIEAFQEGAQAMLDAFNSITSKELARAAKDKA